MTSWAVLGFDGIYYAELGERYPMFMHINAFTMTYCELLEGKLVLL